MQKLDFKQNLKKLNFSLFLFFYEKSENYHFKSCSFYSPDKELFKNNLNIIKSWIMNV